MSCNGCDKWTHKKCTGLTNEQYHKLQSEGNEETSYCGLCNSLMFPSFNVSNVDLKKILPTETKQMNIHCPICYKKNIKDGIKFSVFY